MEEVLVNPVAFSKGINIKELLSSESEFHLDLDFKKKGGIDVMNSGDMNDTDEEDSDSDDVYKLLEDRTQKLLLVSPEYNSFEQLAAGMVECRCYPSGSVRIKVLEEGDGPLVPQDAEVSIHYAAYWEKATIPFDSTLTIGTGAPQRVRLGRGRFLPGIEVALTNVKGPSARFLALLQPEAAWGARGAPPRIKPEPALFVIMLYSVGERGGANAFNELPPEEQTKFETTVRTVQSIRNSAKELFSKKRYKKAIQLYQQAINVISYCRPKNTTEEKEIQELKLKILMNLAVCYCKVNKPKYILNMLENIDRIVDIETHCKALFYYGKAKQMLGHLEEALEYYKKALKLEPKNKDIGKLLSELDAKIKTSAEKEVHMWQKAFKATPQNQEKKVTFDVDSEFESGVVEMCQDLAARDEFARFDLPSGLTKNEVLCIKHLATQFEGLVVEEYGEEKKKKVSIIKRV